MTAFLTSCVAPALTALPAPALRHGRTTITNAGSEGDTGHA
jgi:hypothetical protein